MRNPFAKPDVRVEGDEPLSGTPYRNCHVVVRTGSLSQRELERVRAAIATVISNPEVSVAYSGEASLLDRERIVRLRVTYYGKQVAGTKVAEAVRSVL
jgi:hypothetical protein